MRSVPDSSQNNRKWILFIQLDITVAYLLSTFILDGAKKRDLKKHDS